MTSSLVVSEMCIRDRTMVTGWLDLCRRMSHFSHSHICILAVRAAFFPVSYTHLTLPTICSV
eukprot:12863155-Prorocentrum_lima.AAC.1